MNFLWDLNSSSQTSNSRYDVQDYVPYSPPSIPSQLRSIEDWLPNIKLTIIDSIIENISGYITEQRSRQGQRFSNIFHGAKGNRNAVSLMPILQSEEVSTKEKLQHILSAFESSGNKKHSLRRYIFKAMSGNRKQFRVGWFDHYQMDDIHNIKDYQFRSVANEFIEKLQFYINNNSWEIHMHRSCGKWN